MTGASGGRPPRSPVFAGRLPPAAPGLRIGLLGGSFDPAHHGHRAISLAALRRLRLDRVWWLVAPQNPLKTTPSATLPARLAVAAAIADEPRIAITGVEAAWGSAYTIDTLRRIIATTPGSRFVWLMGADNLRSFHRWRQWRDIARLVAIAVIDRPGAVDATIAAPASLALRRHRRPEREANRLAVVRPPAWLYLHGTRLPVSSTALRAATIADSRS